MLIMNRSSSYKLSIDKFLSESDTTSIAPIAALLPNKKENKDKDEKIDHNFKCSLSESTAMDGSRFRVVLIQEGLGNFGNACYYTREALESAAPIFEGKKIYTNHPSESEENDRPERDVRDVFGWFENIAIEEIEDRAEMHGDLVLIESNSKEAALIIGAIKYKEKFKDQEFVGLSINASGDTEEIGIDDFLKDYAIPAIAMPKVQEAKKMGVDIIRLVNNISDAVSCDLVTEAGAGGKILKLLEEEKPMAIKKKATHREADEKPAGQDDGAASDKDHSDADQDRALIMDMIKKHMGAKGDDEGDDEGEDGEKKEADHMDEEEAMQAYEAYKEGGLDHEEAMKCAAAHMKAAAIMKQKKEKKECEDAHKEDDQKVPSAESETEAHKEDESEDEKKEDHKEDEAKKESKQNINYAAKIAVLERELAKERLEKLIEKKFADVKLPRATTKLFKEATGGNFKNLKDFETQLAIFKAGIKAQEQSSELDFSIVEKAFLVTEETETTSHGLDLSDCVIE